MQRGNGRQRRPDIFPYAVLLGVCLVALIAVLSTAHDPVVPAAMPTENAAGQVGGTGAFDVELTTANAIYSWDDIPFESDTFVYMRSRVFEFVEYLPGTGTFIVNGQCHPGATQQQYSHRFGMYIITDGGQVIGKRDVCLDTSTARAGDPCGGTFARCSNIKSTVLPLGGNLFIQETTDRATIGRGRPPVLYERTSNGVTMVDRLPVVDDETLADGELAGLGSIAIANGRMIGVAGVKNGNTKNAIYALPSLDLITTFDKEYTPVVGVGEYIITRKTGQIPFIYEVYKMPSAGTAKPTLVSTFTGQSVDGYLIDTLNPERIGLTLKSASGKRFVIYTAGPNGFVEESSRPVPARWGNTMNRDNGAMAGEYIAYGRCPSTSTNAATIRESCRLFVEKDGVDLTVEQPPVSNGKRRYVKSVAISDTGKLLIATTDFTAGDATMTLADLYLYDIRGFDDSTDTEPACKLVGIACGDNADCCSGICNQGWCSLTDVECENDLWCGLNERCESGTCVSAPIATAQFVEETATCAAGFNPFFCRTPITYTSEGTGYIQLWREGGAPYDCTPAGATVTKNVIATRQPRTYVLYAATDCEPENADKRTALDTITVRDDTTIPDPIEDPVCNEGQHLDENGACVPDDTTSTTVDHQLSDGQSFSDISFTLPTRPQISPDGKYAVYVQDAITDNTYDLWSVPLAGGDPIRLSRAQTQNLKPEFKISSDSRKVVYIADQDTAGVPELYSVPITGGAPIKLNMDFYAVRGKVDDFLISPTSERIYYRADGDVNNVIELWRVDINGGPSTRLNRNIAVNYDVFQYQIAKNPDGTDQVIYRVGRTVQGGHELWSVPGTGSSRTAFKINTAFLVPGALVSGPYYQISEDGSTAAYLSDAINEGNFDLYSVSVVGGPSVRLNGELNGRETVKDDFLISPDGNTVVYRSDERIDNIEELYSVPTRGGTITKLNGPLTSNGDVDTYAISPDNQYVVYTADQDQDSFNELYSVPIHGGTPKKLNGPLVRGTTVPYPIGGNVRTYRITPDSTRVIYIADQDVDDRFEIYSVPINGGTPTKLNTPQSSNVQEFQIADNSAVVVYGAHQGTGSIYSVPSAGGTPTKLNGRTTTTSDVILTYLGHPMFSIAPNSNDVIYIANGTQHTDLHVATIG